MAACIICMISDGCLHYLYDFCWLPALFCMISDGCLHYFVINSYMLFTYYLMPCTNRG